MWSFIENKPDKPVYVIRRRSSSQLHGSLKRTSKSAIRRTKSQVAPRRVLLRLASNGQCSNRCHRARRGVRSGCMVVFQLLGVHSHFHNASGVRLEWTGTSGVEDRHQSQ